MAALPFMEPLHILGSGSIGLFWAASIRSAFPSYPLAALFRPHHKRLAGRKEITVCTMRDQRPSLAHVPCQLIGDARRRPIRNLILSTKAFQAREAIEGVLPRLDPTNLRILVISNGALGIRDDMLDVFVRSQISAPELIMCTTTHGVYWEAADDDDDDMFHITHISKGRTIMSGMPSIARLWDQSGLNAETVDPMDMEVILWQKLAANCVCDPLTALWKVPKGELSENPRFGGLRKSVVREVSQVAKAINPAAADALSFEALDGFVGQVIRDNLENTSSMHREVERNRKTEIENLNGYVAKKAADLGMRAPANEELVQRIKEVAIIS